MDEFLKLYNTPESFMGYWTSDFHKSYFNEKEEIIKKAIKNAGIDVIGLNGVIDENYIKENFTFIRRNEDKFEHLYFHYGKDDQQRIISLEKEYNIEYSDNQGSYKVTMSQKYY